VKRGKKWRDTETLQVEGVWLVVVLSHTCKLGSCVFQNRKPISLFSLTFSPLEQSFNTHNSFHPNEPAHTIKVKRKKIASASASASSCGSRSLSHIYKMLDYEWNTSMILLAGSEGAAAEPDQTRRQIFDHNFAMLTDPILHGSTPPATTTGFSHHHPFNPPPHYHHHHHHHQQQQQPFLDPRAFQSASTTSFSPPPSMLSLNPIPPLALSHCGVGPGSGLGFLLVSKSEDVTSPMNFEGSGHGLGPGPGLGLNLGGRTYFAASNEDTLDRLYRSKTVESVSTVSSNLPRCQAEGCNTDLSDAKHYHRRHKVCEFHSKAATVIAAGLTQRFCQQCSRLWFSVGGRDFTQLRICHWVLWLNQSLASGWSQGYFRPVQEISLFLFHFLFFLHCFLW